MFVGTGGGLKKASDPMNQSYRLLRASCCECYELNPGPLQSALIKRSVIKDSPFQLLKTDVDSHFSENIYKYPTDI